MCHRRIALHMGNFGAVNDKEIDMSERYKTYTRKEALKMIDNQIIKTSQWLTSPKFTRNQSAVAVMLETAKELGMLHNDAIISVDMEAER